MGGDSFKSGSGNLNFGDSEEADDQEPDETTSDEGEKHRDTHGTQEAKSATEENTTTTSTTSGDGTRQTGSHQYPYFVRRSNVGDERDNRLELFARDEVVSREAEFRSQLASELGTDDVAKTDAREYALLTAFDNVEDVAKLMRGDGYGELD